MNQNKQAPRRRMTRREWRIRRCLRLARNWAVFLAACGAAVALMTSGILWLLPKAHALIAGPEDFVARNYDGTEYQLNLADARLVLVNGNLPLDAEPAPALAVADDATGQQLEAEAAEQYHAMAAAAAAMEDQDYFTRCCAAIRENRAWTASALEALGFFVLPSAANFLFAKHPRLEGQALYQGLKARGILVRWFDGPRTRDFVRITVGSRPQMEALTDAVRDILA